MSEPPKGINPTGWTYFESNKIIQNIIILTRNCEKKKHLKKHKNQNLISKRRKWGGDNGGVSTLFLCKTSDSKILL